MGPVFLAMMLIVVGAVVRAAGGDVTSKGNGKLPGGSVVYVPTEGGVPLMRNIGGGR